MRWSKDWQPVDGEMRVVTKFLWLPKKLGHETRWLERASWNIKATVLSTGVYWWSATGWLDK